MPAERRWIPGFPGYFIALDGAAWSVRPRNGRGAFTKPRRLKITIDRDGYKRVCLQLGDRNVRRGIHQLLMLTFVGPCPAGMECRHLNDNKEDNRLENLCYGTPAQNSADKVANGNSLKGERHHKAKLSEEQVSEIYRRAWAGENYRLLALEFNVSRQTIGAIKTGEVWAHTTKG